jgi:hypothetical protein
MAATPTRLTVRHRPPPGFRVRVWVGRETGGKGTGPSGIGSGYDSLDTDDHAGTGSGSGWGPGIRGSGSGYDSLDAADHAGTGSWSGWGPGNIGSGSGMASGIGIGSGPGPLEAADHAGIEAGS